MRETIRQWPLVLLALLASLVMTSGCKSNPQLTPSPSGNVPEKTFTKEEIVAEVGGITITRQQLMDRLVTAYGSQVLRSMMLTVVVNEEAKQLGIKVTDEEIMQELSFLSQGYEDEEQFYQAMEEQLGMSRQEVEEDARYRLSLEKLSVHNVEVTDAEIDQYLVEHQEELEPRQLFQIAHIVIESKETADALLTQLIEGADFADIARMYSVDEFTADAGGDLGWVENRDPFEDPKVLNAVAAMQLGEVTGPIETERGYVLVQLNGRKELGSKSDEEIRLEVSRQLALGKAVSMQKLEQVLLDKYQAEVKQPSYQP
jgi:foldase protein PrsA